ncbi:MAG TPA: gephyrin-like molybdotransferase Glp [Thermoanaerobaculia bacterium]|nr:gephyrin-like molybdotransferase Glp [Thermoanaerobaculia bacterium]
MLVISPDEAWRRIDARLAPLPEERLARRAALGRVLARPLAAASDVPAADVSAMDGYAVGGAVEPGERRPVAATIAAGDPPGIVLPAGAAARIMTGAPLPAGADRVVPVEATDGGRREVAFRAAAAAGEHIRRRGEVLRAGQPLLAAGTPLTPGVLSLLAGHGYAELPVHRAPSVAVLATGDEVVPPETDPAPGQLRDSHTDFLLAEGAGLGLAFASLGIAPDHPGALAERVRAGLLADVLLLCGGVSMGEFDLVEGVLAEAGCELHFDAVAIQPGKPLVFATHPGGLIFGLPGNPASVMVGFWLFVRPALRRLLGHRDGWWQGACAAILAAPLPGAGARDRFLPARPSDIELAGGLPRVVPLASVGSHDLAAYARGAALVRVPAGSPPAPAGAPCEILPLAGWRA